ncbi:hypothetical protein [Hyalangium minutum]|uniref:Uncharacterized protein n=1 Tax=Hyalangium minutum TaxID=394096 RepID=A0A085WWW8_9BACT|nr:hypothetical protein [Hyalangium minutum]KFE72181.1 hypothetical protein DB31_0442 [Hyalangium minutum]
MAALAIFMVALVQSACGPMPEETSGAHSQTAAASSSLARSLPSGSSSTFDVALSVNNKPQTGRVEISSDALQALGTLRQSNAGEKSTGDARAQSIVQDRIQRMINEGKLPAAEGAAPQISVKLHTQLEMAPSRPEGVEPCLVPATFYTEYYYIYNLGTPSCYYYIARDYYDGFYNQCDGSAYLTAYLYSTFEGAYSCGS